MEKRNMNNIIPVSRQVVGKDEINAVSAHDLWTGLDSRKDFSSWIKARVLSSNFYRENVDWTRLPQKGDPQRSTSGAGMDKFTDYILSLDTAKKVAE